MLYGKPKSKKNQLLLGFNLYNQIFAIALTFARAAMPL